MATGAAWRIALLRQMTSCLYGSNFDCATSSDTFNCTNNFFDPYLPIHHTTFMALQFVLRPFSLSIPNARRFYVEICLSSKILVVFDFVLQKSG